MTGAEATGVDPSIGTTGGTAGGATGKPAGGRSRWRRFLRPRMWRPRVGRWPLFTLLVLFLALSLSVAGAVVLWKNVFISIKPGEAGVLFRFFTGTKLDRTYGEGLHIIPPWDRMYRYELRKRVVMHSFEVLSIRGLPVRMELAIRYRPEAEVLPLLHQRIGPDYPQRVVVPQTESVLRRELSLRTAEEIYTNAGGLLSAAILLARDEVGRNFVIADDIVIRTIRLPDPVREAIEEKQAREELMQSYVFRLETAVEEAERLRDEARGIRDYQAAVDMTLSERLLRHLAITASKNLATSVNSRMVVLGGAEGGLPVLPGGSLPMPVIPGGALSSPAPLGEPTPAAAEE
jgi:prohibitin 1